MSDKFISPLLSQEIRIQEDSEYYWLIKEDGEGFLLIEYHQFEELEGVFKREDTFKFGKHLLPAFIEALQEFDQ